jgi:hypothetical protein
VINACNNFGKKLMAFCFPRFIRILIKVLQVSLCFICQLRTLETLIIIRNKIYILSEIEMNYLNFLNDRTIYLP